MIELTRSYSFLVTGNERLNAYPGLCSEQSLPQGYMLLPSDRLLPDLVPPLLDLSCDLPLILHSVRSPTGFVNSSSLPDGLIGFGVILQSAHKIVKFLLLHLFTF